MKILPDGSVEGQSFTKNNIPYPSSIDLTPEQYHEKANKAKELGFHLGDLSWKDWNWYCRGSGMWRDSTPDDAENDF